MTRCRRSGALLATLAFSVLLFPVAARAAEAPLSPAQMALFETPHLKNITHPETLVYRLERAGPEPLTDTVNVNVEKIHPDGTKYVSFDFLTGPHHLFFPAVDDFSGNPLLMLFLEHDVLDMKSQTGIAAAHFRDHIRAAFVDRAIISDATVTFGGKNVAARLVTLKPFVDDPRLTNLPSFRNKTYRFVLSEDVPGQIDMLAAEMPPDPGSGAPAWSETITFMKEKPE
ncbi:MAG: putative secreted protein [Rhodospirillales bacterium]|nr:putative secreted protein [Rhodospirillales bacterium]